MATLQEKGMLARLHICQWTGRKFDRDASNYVNNSYKAESDAARVNKMLVPKAMLAPVERSVAKSRLWFATNTSPWLDNGMRILSTEKYFDFVSTMLGMKSEFESSVDNLCDVYQDFINAGQARSHMGGMFDSTDYPDKEIIRNRFVFETKFMPIPAQGDWRVAVDADTEAELRESLKDQLLDAELNIYNDICNRITDKVTHVYERLSTDSKFQNRIFDSLAMLSELIPELNVLDDPRVNMLQKQLATLAAADTDGIRKDEAYKQVVMNNAAEILHKMEIFNDNTAREITTSENEPHIRSAVLWGVSP